MHSVQRLLKLCCLTPAVFILWTGCSYKHGKTGVDSSEIQPSDQLLAEVSYSMVNTRIFQPHCVACHGSSGGVNLESYTSALGFLQQIKAAAIDTNAMPKSPGTPLTVEELQILNAWIQVNGRELPVDNPPDPPIPPTPPVLQPTFDSIETNIIHPKCLLCHSAGGSASRVPLDNLQAMINSPLQIVMPKDAAESDLVLVLQIPPLKQMPPANSGISPVSQADLEIIKTWIQNGAKD